MNSIPKLYKNSTIFIVAGGPSLVGQDLCIRGGLKALLEDKIVLGVNNAIYLGSMIDVLFFGDAKWYWWNKEAIDNFKGLKITRSRISPKSNPMPKPVPDNNGILILRKGGFKGLERDPKRLSWNGSSGGCAINVAVHLGAKKIVLLGYDMKLGNKEEKNMIPHPLEHKKKQTYNNMLEKFKTIAPVAGELGVKILNATPGSRIECFEKVDLLDLIYGAKKLRKFAKLGEYKQGY